MKLAHAPYRCNRVEKSAPFNENEVLYGLPAFPIENLVMVYNASIFHQSANTGIFCDMEDIPGYVNIACVKVYRTHHRVRYYAVVHHNFINKEGEMESFTSRAAISETTRDIPSLVVQEAYDRAGVVFHQPFGGCGRHAMEVAFLEMARAAGFNPEKSFLVVHHNIYW